MAGNRSWKFVGRARKAALVGLAAGIVAGGLAACGGLPVAAGTETDPPALIDPPIPMTGGTALAAGAGAENEPPALVDPPIHMENDPPAWIDLPIEVVPDTAERGRHGSTHEVAVEFVGTQPTPAPRCLPSLPTRCALPIANTRTIRGDMTGVNQSTGGATIESGRFTSLMANEVMEITDGPCGAGTFVAQTVVSNVARVRQPDGSVRWDGQVDARIVPGSGTGGYEHASYRVLEVTERPSPGDGTTILHGVLQFRCGS